jgi:hypothetical protein
MERRELLKLGLVGAAILALPTALHAAKKPLRVFAHDKIDLVVMTADLDKGEGRSFRWLKDECLEFQYQREPLKYRVSRYHRKDGYYSYMVSTPTKFTPRGSIEPYSYGTTFCVKPGRDYRKVREEIVEVIREHGRRYNS